MMTRSGPSRASALTGDLDLLWDGHPGQYPRLAAAFASVGATITDADGAPRSCAAETFDLAKVYFHTATAAGDCCTPKLPWRELDIEDVIGRAQTAVGRDGPTVHYVSAADLIVMRRTVGRAKDLRRADELEELLRILD